MIFKELNNEKCKTYLIGCSRHKKAVLVDPISQNIDRYLAVLAYFGLELETVLDTHTHADHRSATSDLKQLIGCKIARHVKAPQPNVDQYFEGGDELKIGALTARILYTPGHTPDSISLYIHDRVLTGDCLLIGGSGRTDFAAGDPGHQYDSVTQQLFTLPDETLVYPAHDYRGNTKSTIGHERQHNPRLAGRSREEYIGLMTNLGLPLPEQIQEVLQINASEAEDTEIDYPSIAELNQVLQVSVENLRTQMGSEHPPCILDVREEKEYNGELGHITGSTLIPLSQLPTRYEELHAYQRSHIVTVCRAGVRSTTAAAMLTAMGFSRITNLKGGMVEWHDRNP